MNYNILIFINSTSWLSLVAIFTVFNLVAMQTWKREGKMLFQVAMHNCTNTDSEKNTLLDQTVNGDGLNQLFS